MNKYIFKLIRVVPGMWATWEQWTQCSRTCGLGKKIRSRNCSSPAPENNGAYCVGTPSEWKDCLLEACTPGMLKKLYYNYEWNKHITFHAFNIEISTKTDSFQLIVLGMPGSSENAPSHAVEEPELTEGQSLSKQRLAATAILMVICEYGNVTQRHAQVKAPI